MAGGEPRPVGVAEDGQLPLPWLRDALAQALQLKRSHALLLHAGVPTGQFELAMALAQAWLCEQPDRAPCGRCTSCRLARQRTHPDLRVVVPETLRVEFDWLTDDDPMSRSGAKPSREIKIDARIGPGKRRDDNTCGRRTACHFDAPAGAPREIGRVDRRSERLRACRRCGTDDPADSFADETRALRWCAIGRSRRVRCGWRIFIARRQRDQDGGREHRDAR